MTLHIKYGCFPLIWHLVASLPVNYFHVTQLGLVFCVAGRLHNLNVLFFFAVVEVWKYLVGLDKYGGNMRCEGALGLACSRIERDENEDEDER